MKTPSLVMLIAAVCSTLAVGAENDPAARQLQVYPKNLARQHLGANLFVFNPKNQSYVPTEAAAAWLDDDITTGWPALPGKQHYLVALPEPEMLSNFSISAKPANGTVTLYAGDAPDLPGAKSWSPLTGAVALESINERKLATPFNHLAKYVLIETNIADPSPIYSVNLYGDKPASIYNLHKRAQTINSHAIFGPYVNQETAINLNGIYAQGRVTYANSPDGLLSWQKAIDDNPESSVTIATSTNESGANIQYGSVQAISRVSLLTDGAAKGKLEFYFVTEPPAAAAPVSDSEFIKASNTTQAPESALGKAVSLEGKTPAISMVLDGSNPRANVDFPATEASSMLVRWVPANGTDTLTIREMGSYANLSLNDYEVAMKPDAIAENGTGRSGKDGKDAKDAIAQGPRDPKDPKGLEPVAQGPLGGSPYLPGALGFPPNFGLRRPNIPTTPTAPTPVSP